MKITFSCDEDDVVVLETRGAMGFDPPDLKMVEQMAIEVERHLQTGKRLFVVDSCEGRFVYGSSFGSFITPLIAIVTAGRARVAFVAKDKRRWRAVFKEEDLELFETVPDAVRFLRSGVPTALERRVRGSGDGSTGRPPD